MTEASHYRHVKRSRRNQTRRTAKEDIAIALLLWRYVNHRLTAQSVPHDASCERATRALALAKLADVRDEYLRMMMEFPILTISVREIGE